MQTNGTTNPRLAKLKSREYPIQTSDIDGEPAQAQRYNIRSVPTYVLTDESDGELARTQGVMSAAELASFYNQNRAKLTAKPDQPATSAEPSTALTGPIPGLPSSRSRKQRLYPPSRR